jgi:hypothetical protein
VPPAQDCRDDCRQQDNGGARFGHKWILGELPHFIGAENSTPKTHQRHAAVGEFADAYVRDIIQE